MITPVRYEARLRAEILERKESEEIEAERSARAVIREVRARGDAAVREYAARFDGWEGGDLLVSEAEIAEAERAVPEKLRRALERAAENIRAFHRLQKREGFEHSRGGATVGQIVRPVDRAGIYVPGGTAAYPSTVLMNAVPAKIAGVGEIVMVTPPGKTGAIKPEVLVAAKIAGVDKIFRIGGAQAVAALACGTESVPRVDVITGPGNVYVAAAKKVAFGEVGIDMIAGPSEILIVADGGANAEWVAADMLSQAEHDRLASAVLVTDSMELALAADAELDRQTALLPRREIAETSLRTRGKIIVTRDLGEAVELSNALAPEHLELAVDSPFDLLEKVRHAGSVFLGYHTPEPLGDYYAGTNHTLPTGGTARYSSPLGVEHFMKTVQYIRYDENALAAAAEDVMMLAECEGLSAHARSVGARVKR